MRQPDHERHLERQPEREPEAREGVLHLSDQVVEQRTLLGAVERRRADGAEEQSGRPGDRHQARRADDRRPEDEPPVTAPAERGQPGEQPEPDAEGVAVADPRLDAVEAHPEELDREVDQHQHGQRLRVARGRPAQLADGERDQPGDGRPVAEPLRVGERLGHGVARRALGQPARRAADRPPRAEQAEDVAEQQREERDADPEADVDRGRGQVVLLAVRPRQAGVDGHREHEHAERAQQHLHDEREAEERPLARAVEHRALPAGRQREEGDDEHGRRRHGEPEDRDRQVGAADDAVSDQPHGQRSL